MRQSIEEKVISAYMLGDYYPSAKDKLRFRQDDECIVDETNSIIAKFESLEDNLGNYHLFVVVNDLTLLNNKVWENHKVKLARAANKYGLKVVFRFLDIGFGDVQTIRNSFELSKHLIKIAKCSQDEDIQTAVRVSSLNYCVYSYNQLIEDEFLHAESVALEYAKMAYDNDERKHEHIYCLYEPCYDCLLKAIFCAESITIMHPHKRKWDTDDYRRLYFKIKHDKMRNIFGNRIFMSFDRNKIVDKFYKGKVNL